MIYFIKEIILNYVKFREELGINNFFYYFWKGVIPLVITCVICFYFHYYVEDVNHKDISTVLVSTSSIMISFLVLSLTVLLTSEIKNIPNNSTDYKEFLVTNAELSTILVLISIFSSLIYMLLSSSDYNCSNEYIFSRILTFFNFFSIFITLLTIWLTISDLLLLSDKIKKDRRKVTPN